MQAEKKKHAIVQKTIWITDNVHTIDLDIYYYVRGHRKKGPIDIMNLINTLNGYKYGNFLPMGLWGCQVVHFALVSYIAT